MMLGLYASFVDKSMPGIECLDGATQKDRYRGLSGKSALWCTDNQHYGAQIINSRMAAS
jgi:hypothetical protein